MQRIFKTIFVIALITLKNTLFASDIVDSIDLINELNSLPHAQCNSCTDDKNFFNSNKSLNAQCAFDLCGNPIDLGYSGMLNDYTYDKYLEKDTDKKFNEFETKIKEMILGQIKKNNNFIEHAKSVFEKEENKTINYNEWNEDDFDNYTWRVFGHYVTYNVDKSKPISERMTYKIDYPEDATSEFIQGIDSYAKSKMQNILTSFTNSLYSDLYTFEEAKVVLKKKFDEFLEKLNVAQKDNPSILKDKNELFAKVKEAMQKSSFKDNSKLASIYYDVRELENHLAYKQTGVYPPSSYKSNCPDSKCQNAIKQYLNEINFQGLVEDLNKKNKEVDASINETISYCKSEFLSNYLKSYDQNKIIKLLPRLKKNFLLNVTRDYSAHSQSAFTAYLNKSIEFVTKQMKTDSDEFVSRINDKYHEFKESSKTPDYFESLSTKSTILSVLEYIDSDDVKEIDLFAGRNFCRSGFSNIIWDGFVENKESKVLRESFEYDLASNKDAILVSMYSCFHPGYGQGIIAHELGHALSDAFLNKKLSEQSYKKFMNLRACANSLHIANHKTHPAYNDIHKGDFLKTEEDTADLISYLAIPDKDALFSCALLDLNGSTFDDKDLNLDGIKDDPHSSPLVRLLREAIHKKVQLPHSCSTLVEQNKDKFRFDSCF